MSAYTKWPISPVRVHLLGNKKTHSSESQSPGQLSWTQAAGLKFVVLTFGLGVEPGLGDSPPSPGFRAWAGAMR